MMFARKTDCDIITTQPETILNSFELHHHRNLSLCTLTRQLALELLIIVAIEGHTSMQMKRHLLWEQTIANSSIDPEAFQLAIVVDIA